MKIYIYSRTSVQPCDPTRHQTKAFADFNVAKAFLENEHENWLSSLNKLDDESWKKHNLDESFEYKDYLLYHYIYNGQEEEVFSIRLLDVDESNEIHNYNIPVTFTLTNNYNIKAPSLEEAILILKDKISNDLINKPYIYDNYEINENKSHITKESKDEIR